ncbi:membrane protein [Weizmannia acidilactici]|uniref:Membrane protein n=1 Tax=Weizmannia acidilactici TaxID=2607726 RepID=A0A5J4JKY9_9BACI|nr:DMT family transporter [Weizmannia acidilactici]GER67565.1 membrane protein [Weizmannia acidilactici]GER71290.1 membrane protein [Weizmannia acidilactici]GER74724.1 membrane protein [Weizmannia acidilactici]
MNPYIALIAGVLAVTSSAILVKYSTADAGVIAFYRLFYATFIMLPILFINKRKEHMHMGKKDLFLSVVAGAFLAFHFILWFESLNLTSVASSTVLVTLQPIFTFAGAYFFFRESLSLKAVLCAALAVFGSILISWGDFFISGKALYGDILALISCLFVTVYLMIGQYVRKRAALIPYTFTVYLASTVVLFFYVVLSGESFFPYSAQNWVCFLLLAILPTLAGHSVFHWVVKWISASVVSVAILFEPVGASILAYFLFQEKISWFQAVGGIIILLSIAYFMIRDHAENRRALQIKEKSEPAG